MHHQGKHAQRSPLSKVPSSRQEAKLTAAPDNGDIRQPAAAVDVREHASALALASLGAPSKDEDDDSTKGNFRHPFAWRWWEDLQAHSSTMYDQRKTNNDDVQPKKRKLDQFEDDYFTQDPSKSSTYTWPSLAFSENLNPLEIRLNIGRAKGNAECHVTVASCVADSAPLSQTWDDAVVSEASQRTDSQHSIAASKSHTSKQDQWQLSQETEVSQTSTWQFLASQASSLGLDDLPDSQCLSQLSVSSVW